MRSAVHAQPAAFTASAVMIAATATATVWGSSSRPVHKPWKAARRPTQAHPGSLRDDASCQSEQHRLSRLRDGECAGGDGAEDRADAHGRRPARHATWPAPEQCPPRPGLRRTRARPVPPGRCRGGECDGGALEEAVKRQRRRRAGSARLRVCSQQPHPARVARPEAVHAPMAARGTRGGQFRAAPAPPQASRDRLRRAAMERRVSMWDIGFLL